MKSYTLSDKGKRKINQDYVLTKSISPDAYLFLLADGMGGYEDGEIAAKLVAEEISKYLLELSNVTVEDIQSAINQANLSLYELKRHKDKKAGATVGGVYLKSNTAICFWVGDVKIFHFHNRVLVFESKPHSLMNEVMNNGSITNTDEAVRYKHVVTRSVQGEPSKSEVEIKVIDDMTNEDLLLISTDGVHDILEGIQIQRILKSAKNMDETLKDIEFRCAIDSKDNYSAIFIQW